jgi:hypothetical protein
MLERSKSHLLVSNHPFLRIHCSYWPRLQHALASSDKLHMRYDDTVADPFHRWIHHNRTVRRRRMPEGLAEGLEVLLAWL